MTYGIPTLVRSIDGQPAVPIAAGIRNLLITYRLTQGCPNCTSVNVPANAAEWNLVSEVVVTITAQSPQPLTTGALYIPQATTVSVQPRNLLAYRSG